jgi:frataxin-like iron-binding protein CyaY
LRLPLPNQVLIIDVGPLGQYSLKRDGDRLQLDSAMSGSRTYAYHAESDNWRDTADGQPLDKVLSRELQELASVRIHL